MCAVNALAIVARVSAPDRLSVGGLVVYLCMD